MYRLFIILAVLSMALVSCKKKADPAAAAQALCACNDPVEAINAEMTAAAGDQAKLTEIATRHTEAMTASSNCIKETVGTLAASLKKENFKVGLLDAMKSQCPQVEKLYARYIY